METNKRLLMANDDLAHMEAAGLVTRILKRRGIEVVIVAEVEQALAQLAKGTFDLIVTDISLQGLYNGIDLIKAVRKTDKKTKIIVSTGYGDFYRQEALDAGADFYFEKPMNIKEQILIPLGVPVDPVIERLENIRHSPSTVSLRKAFHEIDNKHNDVIFITSILREAVEKFLPDKSQAIDAQKQKEVTADFLKNIIEYIDEIKTSAKAANDLFKSVKPIIYDALDPNNTIITTGVNKND
jgi:ActR/RegA family two-component response regulator